MAYLLSQIWLCLLITALVSGLLGWIFRGGGQHKLRALNTQWQDKYDLLSQERNSYATKINKLAGMSHENDRLERKLKAQKQSFDQTVKHLNKNLVMADNEMQRQELLLAQKDEELAMSMAQFDRKLTEFEDKGHRPNAKLEAKLIAIEESLEKEKTLNKELKENIKQQEQLALQRSEGEINNEKQLKDLQQQVSKLETELEETMSELVVTSDKLNIAEQKLITAGQKVVNSAQNNNSIDQKQDQKNKSSVLAIGSIQALSEEDQRRLSNMNIKTTEDLLAKAKTEIGINLLSKSLGKEAWVVRTWVNNADLMRVKGVDGILAELLELSGVNSVKELATSKPEIISENIKAVYEHITKRSKLPNFNELKTLIDEAKRLIKQ